MQGTQARSASQPGFNQGSRTTTLNADGTWTISLRWDSARDADASMANFMEAPATHPDGLAALEEMDRSSRASGETLFYREVHRIIGQGNFVVAMAHQVWNSIDYAAFDIFRLDNGMIVEHWDNVEVLPQADDLVNSGKF